MSWLKRWKKRIRALARKDVVERELEEELAYHLELETEKNRRAGMTSAEARRQASIAFGGVEKHKEAVRDARLLGWVSGFSLDFNLGVRMLAKYPGLTMVGGLAMAFAILVGAVGFEIVTRFFFPKLPLDEGDRVVAIRNWDAAGNALRPAHTMYEFATWRDQLTTVVNVGAFRTTGRNLIADNGQVDLVRVVEISPSAFAVTRIPPLLGRTLVAEDEKRGPPVVVVGYPMWQRHFNGRPDIVGRSVRLGGTMHTVVGVMPKAHEFPAGESFWVPLRADHRVDRPGEEGPAFRVFGRLAPGVTLAEARAEAATIGSRLAAAFPHTHEHLQPEILPYAKSLVPRARLAPAVLVAINAFLFLLVVLICGNVALLMFARAATRESELGVRHALGATRRRIIGQLFAEALVLAAVAGAVGLIAADLGLRSQFGAVSAMGLEGFPSFWERSGLQPITVLYGGLLAVSCAVIAGMVPGMKVTRGLQERLRQASAGGGGFRFGGLWTMVVVVQVAAMVAFPIPAYIVRGEAARTRSADHGFPTDKFLAARLGASLSGDSGSWDSAGHKARLESTYRRLEERLEAEPGVTGVTFVNDMFLMRQAVDRIELDGGISADTSVRYGAKSITVATDYFDLMNAPILMGRGFTSSDLVGNARVVIVNQSFVEGMLHGQTPIGRQLRYSHREANGTPGPWFEIIGVVKDIGGFTGALEHHARAGFYHPAAPGAAAPMVAIHVAGEPEAFARRLRPIAAEIDPLLTLFDITPVDKVVRTDLYWLRLLFWLITIVSTGALLLSLMGIHSVLSFTVAQRTREIGIRVALGGEARRVAATVVRRPLTQVVLGILVGAWLITTFVYMVNQTVTLTGTAMIAGYVTFMVGVCVLASLGPARRALSVQPTVALKIEP